MMLQYDIKAREFESLDIIHVDQDPMVDLMNMVMNLQSP
jgi:hypothetical protein